MPAQGAAQHFVDGRHAVKDLDVWRFYAEIPGQRFPADRRDKHVDFGPSDLGRQQYDFAAAKDMAAQLLRMNEGTVVPS